MLRTALKGFCSILESPYVLGQVSKQAPASTSKGKQVSKQQASSKQAGEHLRGVWPEPCPLGLVSNMHSHVSQYTGISSLPV